MFDLNNLDLSGTKLNTTGAILQPGKYLAKITGFEYQKTSNNGHKIQVSFEDTNGAGKINGWYNFTVPSAEATRIGREQFKALLFFAGVPTPDYPGVLSDHVGRIVGIAVENETYVDKGGNNKTSSAVKFTFDPAELDPVNFKRREAPETNAAPQLKTVNLI